MSFARFLACFVVLLAFAVCARAAQTQTINPVADAFVAASNPNNNYGGAGALAISAAGLSQGEFQTVMRFDLASTKAALDSAFGSGNWQITNVTLKLTFSTPTNGLFNNNANGQFAVNWMQDDSWIEGTGQPNNPAQNGVTFASLPGFLAAGESSLGTFAFTGTTTTNVLAVAPSLMTDMQAGGSVSMHLLAADSAVSYLFNSRSFQVVSNRPELSITAVAIPEPATLALGSLVLPLIRRRRVNRRFASPAAACRSGCRSP
jgi:hypothetical protein